MHLDSGVRDFAAVGWLVSASMAWLSGKRRARCSLFPGMLIYHATVFARGVFGIVRGGIFGCARNAGCIQTAEYADMVKRSALQSVKSKEGHISFFFRIRLPIEEGTCVKARNQTWRPQMSCVAMWELFACMPRSSQINPSLAGYEKSELGYDVF